MYFCHGVGIVGVVRWLSDKKAIFDAAACGSSETLNVKNVERALVDPTLFKEEGGHPVEVTEVNSEVVSRENSSGCRVGNQTFQVRDCKTAFSVATGVKGLYLVLPTCPGKCRAERRFNSFPEGRCFGVEVIDSLSDFVGVLGRRGSTIGEHQIDVAKEPKEVSRKPIEEGGP
jgi:hypothetical protein